jgi:Predicted nucleotidyltransferase
MNVAVITEYNPFHAGHAEQITRAKAVGADTITAFMSGNTVQRGSFAVRDKNDRAKTAIENGANLVIALPATVSLAPARDFAAGAVDMIKAMGIHDTLVFGAESDSLQMLQQAAAFTPDKSGQTPEKSYPSLLQQQMKQAGIDIKLSPNNILAVEYIRSIKDTGIKPLLIPRVSEYSAHAEREKIYVQNPLPEGIFDFSKVETAAFLKLKTYKSWHTLPYLEDGLANRLQQAAKGATSVENFLQNAKCKRYTMARLKRILMCMLLDITRTDKNEPLYAHVLAYDDKGQKLLAKARKMSEIPLSPNFENLAKTSQRLAEIERTANLWHKAGLE